MELLTVSESQTVNQPFGRVFLFTTQTMAESFVRLACPKSLFAKLGK